MTALDERVCCRWLAQAHPEVMKLIPVAGPSRTLRFGGLILIVVWKLQEIAGGQRIGGAGISTQIQISESRAVFLQKEYK